MEKSNEIMELISGYQTWTDADAMNVSSESEAPAATTTFCAFTVSYAFTRQTVIDGC
ncbi:LxmA leader domain family RiPP [Marinactinospora thermotolerans]|uniref:Uncharacterized protein n=1 Tax=Marinactinospora thermotolerans DSM 45154 TaxID=1122192 RepID=A0A1T4N906_9ACTN|nr:LxmA leader domain family RiPP [Marinactinospora thermotolerans]SJZ75537.1 hypothetical protein SAMN02745673_01329 [Marinactinospora thermotolerans DSM 45154]